ncbi:hypothetical protein KC19_VG308700 [Ceratodon purpureus]|uniref:Uncharacterized protein n=1 Tax=Ceratodon purpureus TaxID=3225 RepID=A0A8T0HWB9_CERPU|nr:hypothetical protein KC19_VG308700 [Ceratodon purpureus]
MDFLVLVVSADTITNIDMTTRLPLSDPRRVKAREKKLWARELSWAIREQIRTSQPYLKLSCPCRLCDTAKTSLQTRWWNIWMPRNCTGDIHNAMASQRCILPNVENGSDSQLLTHSKCVDIYTRCESHHVQKYYLLNMSLLPKV